MHQDQRPLRMMELPDTAIDGLMAVGWLTKAKILKPCFLARKKQRLKAGGSSGDKGGIKLNSLSINQMGIIISLMGGILMSLDFILDRKRLEYFDNWLLFYELFGRRLHKVHVFARLAITIFFSILFLIVSLTNPKLNLYIDIGMIFMIFYLWVLPVFAPKFASSPRGLSGSVGFTLFIIGSILQLLPSG